MRRLLVVPAIFVAALAAGIALTASAAPTAVKTQECKGLKVCVRVAGPWVAVPAAQSLLRPKVSYALSCPKGYIVGGLDAEVSDRGIDVTFQGQLGSPVNPGITTARAAFFTAVYAGTTARAPSFRPHIGCMPGSGGGGRVQTVVKAFRVGHPIVQSVLNARLRAGLQRVSVSCRKNERLVGASNAFGFGGTTPPVEPVVKSVHTTQSAAGRTVTATVRAGAAVTDSGGVVQVVALCTAAK